MMTEWITGEVIKVTTWTKKLFSIFIKAPIIPFIPGQFTKLSLEINGKRLQRAYSYVNAPKDSNIEFYLINVQEGQLSPKLAKLCPGQKIMITKQAAGFLVLDKVPICENLWMIASGTGIGPYLSILQEGVGLNRFKHLVLIHAVRFSKDLSYLPLMKQLKKSYNGKLQIQTILSQEVMEHSLTGRIPALIENNQLETKIGLIINPKNTHVLLCGNPKMIYDTQSILKNKRNMKKHSRHNPGHFFSENYW
ncbi:Flavodoxin/ferredoxin--NADP reductase [Candidatus Ecksteinia adelgidicola]|nr:Flavodoxin/ferredoxin--NADP reductase [Candidatus Ecksteinia adelgidicola]